MTQRDELTDNSLMKCRQKQENMKKFDEESGGKHRRGFIFLVLGDGGDLFFLILLLIVDFSRTAAIRKDLHSL